MDEVIVHHFRKAGGLVFQAGVLNLTARFGFSFDMEGEKNKGKRRKEKGKGYLLVGKRVISIRRMICRLTDSCVNIFSLLSTDGFDNSITQAGRVPKLDVPKAKGCQEISPVGLEAVQAGEGGHHDDV